MAGPNAITVQNGAPLYTGPEGGFHIEPLIGRTWRFVNGTGWVVVANVFDPCTVAQLPAAAAMFRHFRGLVTDATQAVNSVSFGVVVTGAGGNTLPVWCDGTNWRVG